MIVHRTKVTDFQNHFTTSGSPVDFISPNFSLNRVNLWYFPIFFVFTFLTHTLCLKSHAWLVLGLCRAPIGPFSTKGSLSRWDVPDVFLFQGRSEPGRDAKLAMHGFLNIEYESEM